MDDCIFCRIIKKEIPKEFIYESDNLVVFPDINPSADIHFLIIPKKHIKGIGDLTDSDGLLLSEVYKTVDKLVTDNNLNDKLYRVMVNGGKAQHVPHLHFHLLGGNWKKFV
ncbi:MAG: HIT domain-containing protein [Candidatus Daviesbacteria bacterium]|nr:HIT domain-containing protein [Candidatus Daviesbacteria bacterium]